MCTETLGQVSNVPGSVTASQEGGEDKSFLSNQMLRSGGEYPALVPLHCE